MSCYIIAEAGVNHNGSEKLALQLVEIAAECGADAIKFQTFKADNLVKQGTATAEYQQRQTGSNDQHEMLKQLEISQSLHEKLIRHCADYDIEFLSTPFDMDSARFLMDSGMNKIKVPSGELTNLPFIRELAQFNKAMILSTGMADMQEVQEAVDTIAKTRQENAYESSLEEMLTVLHCTSNYPTRDEDVNLLAMQTMANKLSLPVGYSDHTAGTLVAVAAVAMGARVIEKHFTLDKNLPGPDHQASLEPDELKLMIRQIRQIEACLGDGRKEPKPSEIPVRRLVRRSVVLNTDKSAGATLYPEDLIMLRPGTGISPGDLPLVIGRKLRTALTVGSMLDWQDLIDA
jgi:N,N'-diacetyllegionaminate synthase